MEYRKNEKGVALLLALGFAALLLVLIMGFATNALIERKAAANVGDRMEIKAIAKSAINRALAAINYQIAMQNTDKDKGVFRFDNIVSKNPEIDETDKLRDEDADSLKDLEEYFYELDKDNKRYVFKYRDGIYLYEYPWNDTDYSYNGAASDAYVKYRRPQWQYVKNADGFLTGRFMYAVLPDMGKVYYKAGIDIDSTENRSGQKLEDFHADAIESLSDEYFADTPLVMRVKKLLDNNKKMDKDNFAARLFYLYGIESDSDITWSGSTGTDNNKRNYRYLLSDNSSFDSDMVYVFEMDRNVENLYTEKKIEYLNKIGETNITTAKQIAANLSEAFNPGTGDVVHDGTGTTFDDTTTYTGNRRTPYINEIAVTFKNLKTNKFQEGTTDDGTTPLYKIKPSVEVELDIELFNAFKQKVNFSDGTDKFDGEFEVVIEGKVQGEDEFTEIDKKTLKVSDIDVTAPDRFSYVVNDGEEPKTYPYAKYKFITFESDSSFPASAVDIGTKNIDVRVKITNLGNWKYKRNDKIVDFSKVGDITFEQTIILNASNDPTEEPKSKSMQIKDARVNLTNWTPVDKSDVGSRNKLNQTSESEYGIEFSTFPDLSTTDNKAKISLADLVNISRGETNKTLDILGTDKELLDQLTTLKKSDLPQLIDINTRSIYLWGGLLSNIKCSDGSTDAVPSANVLALAKAISNQMRNKTERLKRRSGFIDVFNDALSAASPPISLTNEQKQAVIGKIMSLCKIEDYPEYFYMIVIAQGVKENQSDSTNKGKFDSGDTVTAEVRYLVKLYRNNDNKIKILSMEELID